MHSVIDTDLLTARKLRAARQPVAGADFLARRLGEDLEDRLATVVRSFDRAAVLFSPPATRQALDASGKAASIVEVGLNRALAGIDAIVAPAETVPLEPGSIDLAISLLSLHEVNDLPGLLVQVRRSLKPDGLFLAAMAGGSTLTELRQSLLAAEIELTGGAAPRVIPFADVRDMGALLQRAGFALPVTDIDTVVVRYDDMFALLRDLRAMGSTSALSDRSRKPATRTLFARAAQIYAERFADADGRVRATFDIIWLSGWAPAETQRKPLKPGSAEVSLTKVLGGDA